MMKRFWLSVSGGILIPILYYAMVAVFFGIFANTLSENWEEVLLLPLFWPARLLNGLFSGSYNGDFFADLPVMFLLVSVVSNILLYATLTYIVLRLCESRNKLL
jgi:hypothetical protein